MRNVTRALFHRLTSLMVAVMLLAYPGMILPARAITDVVSGTVTTSTGAVMTGVTIELHTPDGLFTTSTTTGATGTYSFSTDLTAGTNYVVEPRTPAGYNRYGSGQSNFLYTSGATYSNINFTLIQTTKTLTGKVTLPDGSLVADAVVTLVPYNITNASNVTARTDATGTYTATVIGGTWFAQPAIDLSEYTQRWISEVAPIRVNFANDTTTESSALNFTVTPASGKVHVCLLNSDGSKLTSSNFVADIDFRRADGIGTRRKVQAADSCLSVYLTPGIYTITAFHNDLNGKSFDPAKTTFVMTEGGVVDLGTVTAETDSAHLRGKVMDTSGKVLSNIHIQAIRENGQERPSGNTDASGNLT